MLTYGTQIQTAMDGRTCNLEDLPIGQPVMMVRREKPSDLPEVRIVSAGDTHE